MCLNPNFIANYPTVCFLNCDPESDNIAHHVQYVVKDELDMYNHVFL